MSAVWCLFFLCMSFSVANEHEKEENWSNMANPPPLPGHWVLDIAAPTKAVHAILVLKQLEPELLSTRAKAVSDPRSPLYGQYLDTAQLIEMISTNPKSLPLVGDWLQSFNIDYNVGPTFDMVDFHTTIAQAEKLFNTTIYLAKNMLTQQTTYRASSLQVPPSIYPHIGTVLGLHELPLPPQKPMQKNTVSVPYKVTPAVISKTYSVSGVTPSGSTSNRQAVAEFQGEYMNKSDLESFFKQFVPTAKAGDEKVYKYVENYTEGEGIEALLDIEYIMGVAPGIKTEFWIVPANAFCKDLVQWTQMILALANPPNVHSVSYGWQGPLSQLGCVQSDIDTIDAEFQKLAAKGITIIFASGDSGSGQLCATTWKADVGYSGTPIQTFTPHEIIDSCCVHCSNNTDCTFWSWNFSTTSGDTYCYLYDSSAVSQKMKGSYAGVREQLILYPSWPASSPWVTSVGSTRFVNNDVGSGPEMATDQFGSGGGFSTMFKAPDWQTDAVKSYFTNEPSDKLPPSQLYPPEGRATPDISGLGEGYQVAHKGGVISVGGTSASAPMFAGLVSLLNEARSGASKPALGFLNPFIYQNPDAFIDVTVGSNRIGRSGESFANGWDAIKGWDPATGLGTPNFQKLLKAALA